MEPSPSYLLLSKEMFQLRCRRWPLITYFYLWVKLILKKKIHQAIYGTFWKTRRVIISNICLSNNKWDGAVTHSSVLLLSKLQLLRRICYIYSRLLLAKYNP
jgi:hypothetical protein